MGWGGHPRATAASTPGKDPVPIVQESGWAPVPLWTGGKSRLHRDSIPDRPASSQSLYRLSYPLLRCRTIIRQKWGTLWKFTSKCEILITNTSYFLILIIKPTIFIFGIKLYMFRTVPLSIIRSFSLYTQQWYMSYRFAVCTVKNSRWWTEELSETCRVFFFPK